ncbi:MAG: potassium-transporting ATPase subunit KdpC [Devosia sp.]
MLQSVRPALIMMVLFTILTGLLYPFAILGIGQTVFPAAANGSLIAREGKVVGSSLIGQQFADPRYFWPRPSAAGNGYDAANSSGSNLGPTSKKLMDRVTGSIGALRATGIEGPLPADAVTASGSGLDPDISPAYAALQIARVASARSLPVETVTQLVAANAEAPFLGFFGEPRVNVLKLNIALDALVAPGG